MTNHLKNDKIGEIFDHQIFEEGIMSYFEQFMQANQAYVALHGQLNLPLKPKTRVAIVTCMDSRLSRCASSWFALGDAHILRNAGGRVTEDMIRSLVISQQQMGDQRDCGIAPYRLWCSDL